MEFKKINESILYDIAYAIRGKLGVGSYFHPHEFASAIMSIQGEPNIELKSIYTNGVYSVSGDADGFNPIVVAVPNSYSVSDEGKVVDNGALVAQTPISFSSNGTYDTTLNNEVTVNVAGGGDITSDATLQSGSQMLSGYTAYARGSKYTGTIPMYNGSIDGGQGSVPSYDYYSGSYTLTPSTVSQAFPTAGKIMSADLQLLSYSAGAEPYSGSYVITPSIFSQAFPTAGKVLSQDIQVEAYNVDYYSGSYLFEPSTELITVPTTGKILASDIKIKACSGDERPTYTGSYEVSPSWLSQVLSTSGKIMTQDLTVEALNLEDGVLTTNGMHYPSENFAGFGRVKVAIWTPSEAISYLAGVPENMYNAHDNVSIASAPLASFVGGGAFEYCSNLTSIDFPICEFVDWVAFANCPALENVSMPMVSALSEWAFRECTALPQIYLPACTFVSSGAFGYCSNLQSVDLPVCGTIGSDAFMNCISLTDVSFPSCTNVSGWAFANCYALEEISLPECSILEHHAFYHCSALQSVSIPECRSVGRETFLYCEQLSAISLPKATFIDELAFGYCRVLESVYLLGASFVNLSDGGQSYTNRAFQGTPMEGSGSGTIYVPSAWYNTYVNDSMWSYYSSHIVGLTSEQIAELS